VDVRTSRAFERLSSLRGQFLRQVTDGLIKNGSAGVEDGIRSFYNLLYDEIRNCNDPLTPPQALKIHEDVVRRIVASQMGIDEKEVDLDKPFREIGADSLDDIELVDEDAELMLTPRHAVAYLEKLFYGRNV
jgi:acyl carrier protein